MEQEGDGMHLENYHYLLEIDRHKSISSAARALHLPQTTLSSIINAVERELGFSIFYRTPSGMVPTTKGKQFLSLARDIDIRSEELLNLSRQDRPRPRTQPISLLMSPGACAASSIEIARRYNAFALPADLTMEEWPRLDIPPLLVRHTANVGLTFFTEKELRNLQQASDRSGIIALPLLKTRFFLLVNKDNPMAQRQAVTKEDFQNAQFCVITTCSSSGLGPLFKDLLQDINHQVAINNYSLMRSLIMEQNMVGFATWFTLYCSGVYDPGHQVALPLCESQGVPELNLCLLHRGMQHLRYQERILVDCIKEYIEELCLPEPPGGQAAESLQDERTSL